MDAKIDQLAQSTEREQGKLPSNTENNPREGVMAISLRSGTQVGDGSKGRKVIEIVDDGDNKEESEHNAKQGNDLDKEVVADPSALAKMPSYAKFLKELVSNKSKLEEYATVALTEECSAILQKKLPHKLKDPWSFSIPCVISDTTISKCLCDLGASVNIMPASLYKKLGIKEMKPTTVSLQLVDRLIKYHLGIVEDLFVQVGKMGSEKEEFNILKAMKHPSFDDSCFNVDIIDHVVSHIVEQESFKEPLEAYQ
ncbi:uncharacterized protein LOC126681965 [Mercurialis annua]|uniref:uncharacterized protein LOC126681965 n=1 Tax=Mercurialis annua TaxID=3986 RepID=UPI00215E6997|nr:uncharacterized protein LOC126681965 [Mercurialis annua]